MIEYGLKLEDVVAYDTAWLYCATLTHNNHYDWRLPTSDEWYKFFRDEPTEVNYSRVWYQDRITPYQWFCLPVRTKDA
jgi:hypothetical protein